MASEIVQQKLTFEILSKKASDIYVKRVESLPEKLLQSFPNKFFWQCT